VISFLNRVKALALRRNIFIRLRKLEKLGPEAIAVLLATLSSKSCQNTTVAGDIPENAMLCQVLTDSGFYQHVSSKFAIPDRDHGRIRKESKSNNVEASTAAELIDFATLRLFGQSKKAGPSYNLLLEAMGNTFDHASRRAGETTWWASAYFNVVNHRVSFTVVDLGVGIFGSRSMGQRLKLWVGAPFRDRGEALKRLLLGEIPSRTGVKNRGRGLPNAYETWKDGRIKNLVVIANNAYGNAENDDFREMKESFDGTIVYWEI